HGGAHSFLRAHSKSASARPCGPSSSVVVVLDAAPCDRRPGREQERPSCGRNGPGHSVRRRWLLLERAVKPGESILGPPIPLSTKSPPGNQNPPEPPIAPARASDCSRHHSH